MAEELLFLGALLEAADNQAKQEEESKQWNVTCTKCDARLQRMTGRQAYNLSETAAVQCDGCRRKIPSTRLLFHCPKQQNLFHPNGFDYCLDCADKMRDKSNTNSYSNYSNTNNNNSYTNNNANNTNNNNNNNQSNYALRQEIAEKDRNIQRLRNEVDELRRNNQRARNDKNDLENQVKTLRNEKDELYREKRQLNNRINDNLDLIDQQKEEIRQLKFMNNSTKANNDQTTKGYKVETERLQSDKLELQNKYRMIKQQLDEKLDVIEQYKDDLNRMKREKEEIINNYNQQLSEKLNSSPNDNNKETPGGGGRRNEISPTLKAIFTQKFFGDAESKQMPQKQYITKIHTEILGMAFASHATIEWMKKNCRVCDEEKSNGNNNGDVGFSFNTFVNDMDNNNNYNKDQNESKPIVNLKEFDLMTIQKLQKSLKILQKKYTECINSTKVWEEVVQNIVNTNNNQQQQPQSHNYYNANINVNTWQYWNYHNIIAWMMSLDNGRFLKYEARLKSEFSLVALNGMGLREVQSANLAMYGVEDFHDQMRLVHHIDALTGRKQKQSQPLQSQPGGSGHNASDGDGVGVGDDEGVEGANTSGYVK